MRNKAVLIVGHGSKLKGFEAPMLKLARELRKNKSFDRVECAYLEITPPSIPEAVKRMAAQGVREVRLLPYFLLGGRHTKKDIPKIVFELCQTHPDLKIGVCPYLGYDSRLLALAQKRIREARFD